MNRRDMFRRTIGAAIAAAFYSTETVPKVRKLYSKYRHGEGLVIKRMSPIRRQGSLTVWDVHLEWEIP